MAGSYSIGQERQPGAVRRPRRAPVAPRAVRDPDGRVGVPVDEIQVARRVRANVCDGRVQRERDHRSVGRERELSWGPDIEQALVDRAVELACLTHEQERSLSKYQAE